MRNLSVILLTLVSCAIDYTLEEKIESPIIINDIDIESTFPIGESVEDTVIEEPIEEPDIEIDFIPTDVTEIKPGCTTTGKFLIKNVGGADLVVDEIDSYTSVPADARIISNYVPLPLTIAPGDFHTIEFRVDQSDNIEDKIIVVAKSNDPDEPSAYLDATYTSDPGAPIFEEFKIEERRSADILMIVDNSCSMQEEQSALSSNAELFIDSLESSTVDYRIAVITTDRSTFVGPVITPTMLNPALELSNQVNIGISGSSYEMGIMMASRALNPGGMAAPGGYFLRTDARLSIVWISDEDDFSGGTISGWASDFWSKKSSPGEVSVWGIIGDPIYGCSDAFPADIYHDLIVAMSGGWSSICSADWGTPMASVAGSIGADSTLELSGVPMPTTIRVFVDGVESFDWVYVVASNVVSFNPGHIPAVGSNITISYNVYEPCN